MGRKIVQGVTWVTSCFTLLVITAMVVMISYPRFSFGGMSYLGLSIRAGLVGFDLDGELPHGRINQYFQMIIDGGLTYGDMYGTVCGATVSSFVNACPSMQGAYYGSFYFFIAILFSIVADLTGASLYSSYWSKGVERGYRFRSKHRTYALAFLSISSFLYISSFGLLMYFISQLMSALISIVMSNSFTFGSGFFVFGVLAVVRLMPLVLICFAKSSYDEWDPEDDHEDDEDEGLKNLMVNTFRAFSEKQHQDYLIQQQQQQQMMMMYNNQQQQQQQQMMNQPLNARPSGRRGGRKSLFGLYLEGFNPAAAPLISSHSPTNAAAAANVSHPASPGMHPLSK